MHSNSGMGLWYPEIQNRLGARPEGDRMTICQVIDAAIEQQQGLNQTDLVRTSHSRLLIELNFQISNEIAINPFYFRIALVLSIDKVVTIFHFSYCPFSII